MREEILNTMIEIKEKKTNVVIPILKKELLFESSKYSSIKNNIWHVLINDIKMKKTSEYVVNYQCLSCKQMNTVSTTQFLRKIRQCKTNCFQCQLIQHNHRNRNDDQKNTNIKVKDWLSYQQVYEKSLKEFELYPEVYKNSYQLSHLSKDDYERIKPNIISFENGKYINVQDYEYWHIYKVNNQMKFSSVLYDPKDNRLFKDNQSIMKCDHCEKHWRCKSLKVFKNCYKILCPDCKLCNKTFKIRTIRNLNHDVIMYQSKLELKFIKWCESEGIIVNNGPSIEYTFLNKIHKYRVDFQIFDNDKKNNILIEIKDFHIWHKNQVASGLWETKVKATEEYIKNNGLKKYFFITPNNWNQMLTELLIEIKRDQIEKINK